MAHIDGTVEAYLGDRGTGKSTLARKNLLAGTGRGALAIYCTPNGPSTDPFPGPDRDPSDRETPLPYAIAMRARDVDEVCQFAIDCAAKFRVSLLIDEAHESFPEHFSGGPRSELFHRGRHYGIRLMLVSQWPARIDKRIFRAASSVYWFRLHAAEDLWWIKRRWGVKAASQISNLPKFKHILVSQDELPEAWRDSEVLRR